MTNMWDIEPIWSRYIAVMESRYRAVIEPIWSRYRADIEPLWSRYGAVMEPYGADIEPI